MKTDELIHKLSKDASVASRPPLLLWLAGTALGGAAVMAATVALLPISPFRADLLQRFLQARFLGETLLWLTTAAATFSVVYKLSIPGLWRRRDALWAVVPAGLFLLLFLSRPEPMGAGADWAREMDWVRGFCGPVIFWVGLSQAALMAWIVRKAAPTRLALAGFWIAFGSGAFGSFLMQFVCPKENFAHVALWHVTPVLVLAAAGAILGRKLLRW